MERIRAQSKEGSKNPTRSSSGKERAQKKKAPVEKDVKSYLQRMEQGGFIQSFGCVMLLEDRTFRVLAYSENVGELLCVQQKTLPRTLQIIVDRIKRSISRRSKDKISVATAPICLPGEGLLAAVDSGEEGGTPPELTVQEELRRQMKSKSGKRGSFGRTGSRVGKQEEPLEMGIGVDARMFFSRASVVALENATGAPDMEVVNPVLVQARLTKSPFYAVLHPHPGGGILMDLEPILASDPVISGAGALQAHRFAAKAVNRIQTLPSGNTNILFQTVVEEIRALTGYDRVMAYRFHDDEHGEVIAEDRSQQLESYLGLHYPSSDIPKAARLLFVKNRCRMICDSQSKPVKLVEDRSWLGGNPVSLGMSTMRGVHGCHSQYMANMKVGASLTLSLVMREQDGTLYVSMPGVSKRHTEGSSGESSQEGSMNGPAQPTPAALATIEDLQEAKLWGMVVCHHRTPRYVPYPIRSSCEFLMQVFGLQLTREVEAESQRQEHHILHLQTLLCELMMRPNPIQSLMSASPGLMDLVKCNGVALVHQGAATLKGVTPTEPQINEFIAWMQKAHPASTGFAIDSLLASGFPKAEEVGDKVCGLAAALIGEGSYLFWFRSHVEKEISWSGAKQEKKNKDNIKQMTPRASFNAFLEVVKHRSQPWGDLDVDAIHSVQLILRDALLRMKAKGEQRGKDTGEEVDEEMKKLYTATFDQLVHFIEAASAPILAVDLSGNVTGWNKKAAELTGLSFEQACGKSLVDDLLDVRSKETVQGALNTALQGTELQNIQLRLHVWGEAAAAVENTVDGTSMIVANTFVSRGTDGSAQGVCFVGQDVTKERVMQDQFMKVQGDYSAIVHNKSSLIPPIFGCDELGRCVEWNLGMQEVTGWHRGEVMNKMLVGHAFGVLCKLEGHDAKTALMILLSKALAGHKADQVPFSFLDKQRNLVEVMLSVHPRYSHDGLTIRGAFCFLHIASLELRQTARLQRATQKLAAQKAREVAYIRSQVKGPLEGLECALAQLSMTGGLSALRQKGLVWAKTMSALKRQMDAVLGDADMQSLEQGHFQGRSSNFTLDTVVSAVVAQATVMSNSNASKITSELPGDLRQLPLSGEPERLQQVLGGFAIMAARFTSPSGLIKLEVSNQGNRIMRAAMTYAQLEIRISHTGAGIPSELIQQMMDDNNTNKSQEGLVLHLERLILKAMSGDVQYVREGVRPCFIVHIDIALATNARRLGFLPI